MSRFTQTGKPVSFLKPLLATAVLAAIAALFICGIFSVSDTAYERQKESLTNALSRSITYCYTVEGSYPDRLEYIEENYGLIYNRELFYVDYRTNGANIYPDVTVLEIKEK